MIALGRLALEFSLIEAAGFDPMLFDAAFNLLGKSGSGSAAEQRGALCILLMGCPALRSNALALADECGWDAARMGGHAFGLIRAQGGDPSGAVSVVFAALKSAREPVQAPQKAPEPTRPAEPMPGRSPGHGPAELPAGLRKTEA